VYHVICRCRTHQHLARQEGGFVACFPLNVLMVHSPKPVVTTDGNHQTDDGFTMVKSIHFGSLEFVADRFGVLSLFPEGNDLDVAFVEMVHSGSPSLHTILEESTNEDNITSSGGGSSAFLISQGCNVVTPTVPVTTTPPSEGTSAPLTIPTVPL
jgi:hypothetical protein